MYVSLNLFKTNTTFIILKIDANILTVEMYHSLNARIDTYFNEPFNQMPFIIAMINIFYYHSLIKI